MAPSDVQSDTTHVSRRHLLIASGAVALAGGALVTQANAQGTPASSTPVMATPPSEQPSKDVTADELDIAKAQGMAYGEALTAMRDKNPNQALWIANYEVTVLAQKAGGLYLPAGNSLEWTPPGDANAHLEVSVRDAGDGRFIPQLDVSMSVTGPDGTDLGTQQLPFLWHPVFYHYGENWKLPGDGEYAIHVRIEAPTFGRHDETNGKRYLDPVEFDVKLNITTGQM